jgi:adenylate kinase family enzyme
VISVAKDKKFILNIELPTTIEVMAADWREAKELGFRILHGVNMEVKTKKEIIDRVVKFEIHDMNVDEVLDENGEFPKGSFGEEE